MARPSINRNILLIKVIEEPILTIFMRLRTSRRFQKNLKTIMLQCTLEYPKHTTAEVWMSSISVPNHS